MKARLMTSEEKADELAQAKSDCAEFERRIHRRRSKPQGPKDSAKLEAMEYSLELSRKRIVELEQPPQFFWYRNPALMQGPPEPPEPSPRVELKLVTRQQLVADWRFLRATVVIVFGHLWAYLWGRHV